MKTFKKIFFPSGEQTEAIAYESWTVRWYSRYGQFSSETRQECEEKTKCNQKRFSSAKTAEGKQ